MARADRAARRRVRRASTDKPRDATRRDSATRDARDARDDMRATRAGIYL
jgi:hypothetical protein